MIKKLCCLFLSTMLFMSGALNTFAADSYERLEVNDNDIQNLISELSGDYYYFLGGYNYRTGDYSELVEKIMVSLAFNNEGSYKRNGSDPLNKFYGDWGYYAIPAEVVDNIVINIFNTVPNHNYTDTDTWGMPSYYYNNNYYIQIEGIGGGLEYINIHNYKKLTDGRYYISGLYSSYGEVQPLYILADLKNVDNKRLWSYYIISDIPIAEADEQNKIKIILNGKQLNMPSDPVIENGTTLVPMRAIFEAMGATVRWNNDTKTVFSQKDDIAIILTLNSNTAFVNGGEVYLSVSGKLIDGVTMVPLRFVSESMGAEVNWDNSTKTITING